MADVTVERRGTPRYPMVLAAEVIELPRGARLSARTADISRTGCHIDTLNPIPQASLVRLRLTHHDEVLEVLGQVTDYSYEPGMGVAFTEVTPEQQATLDHWLNNPGEEFEQSAREQQFEPGTT